MPGEAGQLGGAEAGEPQGAGVTWPDSCTKDLWGLREKIRSLAPPCLRSRTLGARRPVNCQGGARLWAKQRWERTLSSLIHLVAKECTQA